MRPHISLITLAVDALQRGAVVLAHNVASVAAVEAVMAQAERASVRIVKPAQRAFWGGHAGYFQDPDGHLWEVAFNPHLSSLAA